MSTLHTLFPFARAVVSQLCWHPETAAKLSAIEIRPSTYPTSAPATWAIGTVAHYWRFGIPELWQSFLPPYVRGLLWEYFGPNSESSEEYFGIRKESWLSAMVDLMSTMILHPLHVANLHYLALPFSTATGTGFLSTRDAFVQLYRLNPANLFVGLPMAMINALLLPLIRGCVNRLLVRIRENPDTEPLSKLLPLAEPLAVLLHTPTRVLSLQAMAQTAFLRPHVANFSTNPFAHLIQLFQRSGILGFFNGAHWAVLAALGRGLLTGFVSKQFLQFADVKNKKIIFDTPFLLILAATFLAADVSPRLFVLGFIPASIHEETPTAPRSTVVY